ncbi:Ankyrin repeat domain-containing protein 17 [Tolypocladium ophioglossoides CBS 100239]|uniref:Ankyrin repeat domain-containing protein 17 n=1 Tax=Tolypocladium ophioglossoides (strain CBS 100239) TaxID=1163406 RepID=A0A0L0N0D6_TOLOC|nr:Ankyrin repeat domain-containing protein 17 [Tolypocladium ophioglossoides CBS 100239]
MDCWLCPPDSSTNANRARGLRHEGTGAWLLETSVFQSWKAGSRRHLWLYGLAGCGKTVLSTTILDHLAKANDSSVLSFFFDFGDTTKQTVDAMLRSLASQLYHGGASSAGPLNASFQAHEDGFKQPATKALETVKKVYVVLDALDESTTRTELLSWIRDMASKPGLGHVQLLYTSRPESEFLRDIPSSIGEQNCLVLDKQAINADIRSYVTAQISQRRDFQDKPLPQHLHEQIRKKVGDGADGMFRWAFCQLDSLARCRHEAAIEKALASLPQNLNETYRRMIESIPAEMKSDAIRLLQFLVHCPRPLTLAEAKEVIATQIEEELRRFDIKRRLYSDTDLLDYCPGLVTIDAEHEELHLAHFSVKEYLVNDDQLKLPTASISITKTCLTYLTDIEGSPENFKWDFPVAWLAVDIWPGFAVRAEAIEDIGREIMAFLREEALLERWHRSLGHSKSCICCPSKLEGSRLYYVCLNGLVLTAGRLLEEGGVDVDVQGGGIFGNALQAASSGGHTETVRLLLEEGADVNAQGSNYENALRAASSTNHTETVRLLLERGAEINAQSGEYGNALQAASFSGHTETIRLLFERGAEVNAQSGKYGNALQAASFSGHTETQCQFDSAGDGVKDAADGGKNGFDIGDCSAFLAADTSLVLNESGWQFESSPDPSSVRLVIVVILAVKSIHERHPGSPHCGLIRALELLKKHFPSSAACTQRLTGQRAPCRPPNPDHPRRHRGEQAHPPGDSRGTAMYVPVSHHLARRLRSAGLVKVTVQRAPATPNALESISNSNSSHHTLLRATAATPTVVGGYRLSGDGQARMAAQLLLGELHRVQLINVLASRLKPNGDASAAVSVSVAPAPFPAMSAYESSFFSLA